MLSLPSVGRGQGDRNSARVRHGGVVRVQRTQEFAQFLHREPQPPLDGAEWDADPLGNLLMRKAAVINQIHDYGCGFKREKREADTIADGEFAWGIEFADCLTGSRSRMR